MSEGTSKHLEIFLNLTIKLKLWLPVHIFFATYSHYREIEPGFIEKTPFRSTKFSCGRIVK